MEARRQQITLDTAKLICEAVFDSETKEALKVTLPTREIPLYKQFYYYFEGQILKYDIEQTIDRAGTIFDYSKQEVTKYKLFKEQLDKLNNPTSFFNANKSDTVAGTTVGALNTTNKTVKNKNTALAFSKVNNSSILTNQGVARSGSSQHNEDYKNLESSWKKLDSNYDQINNQEDKESFDIKLPESLNLEEFDLNKAIVKDSALKLDKGPELLEEHQEAPEISYTDISLNKSLSAGINRSANTNKSLNANVANNTDTTIGLNTNVQTNKSGTFGLSFVYGDATYKALGLYVANFKESFFSSFSKLFIEPWTGYS